MNPAEIISCPAVTTFMQKGSENVVAEVANLQSALKNIEHMDVDVNGDYDDKTEAAVMAFQRKYSSEVLAPWGATKPSGIVNITTAKKINQIACLKPLTLDPKELNTINAYKERLVSADNGQTASAADSVRSAVAQSVSMVADDKKESARETMSSDGSLARRFGRYVASLFR